jgi:site-specific DNA-methyltransferase (adenine-specific)
VPAGYGLLCTDPPYGVRYRSNWGTRAHDPIPGDDGSVDWPAVLGGWIMPGNRTGGLARSRHVYVFGYTPDQLRAPLHLAATAELIWDKDRNGQGDLALPRGLSHERITLGICRKDGTGPSTRGALAARLRQGSVLRYRRSTGSRRHPTEKPVPLMADLIESSTVRGDLVVDPCAGSGSTGVAAVLEGRRCFLVEIDRAYAELAVTRVVAAERIAALIDAA